MLIQLIIINIKTVSVPELELLLLYEKGTRLTDFLPSLGVPLMATVQKHLTHYY